MSSCVAELDVHAVNRLAGLLACAAFTRLQQQIRGQFQASYPCADSTDRPRIR